MRFLRDKVLEMKEKNSPEARYTFSKKDRYNPKEYIIIINDNLMQSNTFVDFQCVKSPSKTSYNTKLLVWNQTLSTMQREEYDVFRKQTIDTKGFE